MDRPGSKAGPAGTQARVYGASQFRDCHQPPVPRREAHAVQSACAQKPLDEAAAATLSPNARPPVALGPLSANI
jgi:hypothetical protein